MKKIHGKTGFTLIEAIIYLALFAVIFSGALAAAVNVAESSARSQAKIMVLDEGEFLAAKIRWAFLGAQSVEVGETLTVNRLAETDGGSLPVMMAIRISVLDGNMILSYPGGAAPDAFVLNNSNVKVSNIIFRRAISVSAGNSYESVIVGYRLSTKTDTGQDYYQDFEIVNYLKN
jgi:hypothetical protein